MTTVQFEISDQSAAALKVKATRRGVSAEQYVRQMVDRDLDEESAITPAATTAPRRHISEVIEDIISEAPLEVFETLPRDGASEHDHYLYGAPKRNR